MVFGDSVFFFEIVVNIDICSESIVGLSLLHPSILLYCYMYWYCSNCRSIQFKDKLSPLVVLLFEFYGFFWTPQ